MKHVQVFAVGLLLAGFAAVAADGQQLVLTGPAVAGPGQTITLQGTLTGIGTKTPASFQWTLASPVFSQPFTATTALPGRSVGCNANGLCVLWDGTTPTPDGLLVTITAVISPTITPGAKTLNFTNTLAADATTASPITINPGTSYTLTIKTCDLNSDGKVDSTDTALVATAILGAPNVPCPMATCNLQTLQVISIAAQTGVCLVNLL